MPNPIRKSDRGILGVNIIQTSFGEIIETHMPPTNIKMSDRGRREPSKISEESRVQFDSQHESEMANVREI